MKQDKRIVFQAVLSEADDKKLREICKTRDVRMSDQFRTWIRNSHKSMKGVEA